MMMMIMMMMIMMSFQELCATADEQLFNKIQHNKHHLLHYILPASSAASQCYSLQRSCFRNTVDTLWTLASLLSQSNSAFHPSGVGK